MMALPSMPYHTLAPGAFYFLSSIWDISSLNIGKILSSCHSNLYSQVTPARKACLLKESDTPSPTVATCVFQEETAPGSTIHNITAKNLRIQTFHCNKISWGRRVFPNLHKETESCDDPAPFYLASSSPLLNTRSMPSSFPPLSSWDEAVCLALATLWFSVSRAFLEIYWSFQIFEWVIYYQSWATHQ